MLGLLTALISIALVGGVSYREYQRHVLRSPSAKVTYARRIQFAGLPWAVKHSGDFVYGPGPNHFSNSEENVWVDERGALHLRVTERGGRWYCAEVVLLRQLGYGRYSFVLEKLPERMDPNAVLGLFTWSDRPEYGHREMDVEFSQWGWPDAENAHFTLYAAPAEQRMKRYSWDLTAADSLHRFRWLPNEVHFTSGTPASPSTIAWTYGGPTVPDSLDEAVRINLWLHQGTPPIHGKSVEVVVRSFQFEKAESLGQRTAYAPPP